ncbi:MAG: 2-oxoglutarate dehydrogenase E1 component [Verrucomicrobia bacterium]|nr:2-oxoglutarate dehydrogenase E1 component [Verrucomicrobiota bacterium]
MKRESKPAAPASASLAFLESLQSEFIHNPAAAPPEWRRFLSEWADGDGEAVGAVPDRWRYSVFNPPSAGRNGERAEPQRFGMQDRVELLLRNYRAHGHNIASVDPLRRSKPQPPELEPEFYGFTEADMERPFACPTLEPDGMLPLREILQRLRNTYCRSIGVEFMHMDDLGMRQWLQQRMERTQNRLQLEPDEQRRILTRLTDATVFEEFIRHKFIGAKSFSLEGSESLVPLLDLAIERAGEQGVTNIVMGMAHRGRLNVLANILGKSPLEIFREFEGTAPQPADGGGDVKYHLGYSHDWITASQKRIHLTLCFNPSHLEFINPVATGRVRARQDRDGDSERHQTLLLLIHGDAAFIGEGIVQETLNLSRLPGYTVGGTLHIILNNQIGFTTPPSEGRSTLYAASVARMLPAPIFHVNGEDPEAVAQCLELALEFRRLFRLDVVIDMYGYRRLGHNETDEPTFTQPVLYRRISRRPSVREGYLEHLLALGGLTRAEADQIAEHRCEVLEQNLAEARAGAQLTPNAGLPPAWNNYVGGPEPDGEEVATGVARERLASLLESQTKLPEDFHPHPKVRRGIGTRLRMARGEQPLDWAAAESLAFATLATEGVRVRLAGQDSARGTFSHRHAVLHDFEDGHTFTPLQHLAPDQAPVEIVNSPLCEAAALGFEYGYSLECPNGLVLWEAQFGDFVNAAQVIVDQFIVSAEKKWSHLSGLVLLLPHGMEGMGPEHSSARPERFLAQAAGDNIQVIQPTTPAQYFHALRRQALRRWRKPLVVLTPKSLLRHPQSVSSLEELAAGRFQRILGDPAEQRADKLKRVLLCSGKLYFELAAAREQVHRDDIALLRLEQLYPLPDALLQSALACYRDGTPVLWVQEEPANMGAWPHLRGRFGESLFGRLPFSAVARPPSASPAAGSSRAHKLEQARLIAQALGGET